LQGCERDQATKLVSDLRGGLILRMQRPGTGTVANVHPGVAHVIEIDRARPGMFQVADEFRENPRLVGVADGPIRLLNQCLCADLAPGQVMQSRRLSPGLWQLDGMHPGNGSNLIGNSEQGLNLTHNRPLPPMPQSQYRAR
jgi:hypothetical protein